MARRLLIAAAVVAAATGAARSQSGPLAADMALSSPHWSVFSGVERLRVDYPMNLFSVETGPSPHGDGTQLTTPDGRAELLIYAEPNEHRDTPESYIRSRMAVPKNQLDYTRITDRFFAISGVNDDRVFYSRCNFPAGASGPMHCIYLLYPTDEVRSWDAIVTRISRSLKGTAMD